MGETVDTDAIAIPADIRAAIIEHAHSGLPNETCGFLAGEENRVTHFFPIRNEDQSPMTYFMDAGERFRAEAEIEAKGWRVVAIYHSHTHTPAEPSATDRERAFWADPITGALLPLYPDVRYVIVSLQDAVPSVRAWRITGGDPIEEAVSFDA